MLLPNGISGFYDSKSNLQIFEPKRFKQICYRLIDFNQGKLLSFDCSLDNKNFYIAELILIRKHCYLLMNAYYPYFAFASSIENGNVTFIEIPKNLMIDLSDCLFLNQDELTLSCEESIQMLNSVELYQIQYYKPKTVGEIIYNFWD
ncbi:MAG: hypothetical protein ACLUVC_01880 [Longibaculum sp.]